MKRLLLIDAYAMIYRAYYAFMQHPRVTSTGQNTSAVYGFVITLDDLLKKVQPTHMAVAFDPKGKTFRHEAFEQYKAQRQATPEDIHAAVPYIKDILAAMNIPALEVEGFEADDVIGTLSKKAEKAGFEVLMATPDKDYGQLVTEHIHMYRPRHTGGFENMGPKEVCEKYGLQSTEQVIDLLALMGDSSDNIPGCKGVGEKTAVKLLQDYGSVDNLLKHTDELKGALRTKIETQVEEIRFSYFLATIRTDVPIELNESQLLRQDINLPALTKIYQSLEFRSLLKKYEQPPMERTKTDGFDLFAQPIENSTSVSEPLVVETRQGLPRLEKVQCIALTVESSKEKVQQDLFSSIEEETLSVFLTADGEKVYKTSLVSEVKLLLENPAVEKLGFDLKNDYKRLLKHGVHLQGDLYDTGVAHYLLQPEQNHDIDYLSDIYLHKIGQDTASKVAAAFRLNPVLQQDWEKQAAQHRLQQLEMQLIPVLAEMEMAGVRFDLKVLSEASQHLNEELAGLEKDILSLAGVEFNINSPRQVGEVLFETLQLDPKAKRTKSGQYVTSEEVLQELQDKHPVVEKILEYRAVKKLLSTYVETIPSLINPETGKVHTTYNQTVTATGRLSSSNPNLQNLPIRSERGKDIRRAVIPDENCVFLSADYSQIELRLMAHFSQDEHLLAAFRQGQDIHAATAAKIFNCPIEDVTKEMRRKAKTANFGIIYGISAFGLSQQLHSSRSEAKELIDGYFASFPQVMKFIEKQKQTAHEKGYVETLFGRRRYLPDINSRNATVRNFAERNAVNAPIQGTAADIIKVAMVRIHRRLQEEKLQAKMIMQVHDELNFNVPKNEVHQVREIVVNEMQNAISLSVPLIADCGFGDNWLVAH